MKKTDYSFLAFDKYWFIKHQRFLLFLLNSYLTRRWFRYILRIRSCDCLINTKIIGILPNAFFISTGNKNEYQADFRTNEQFARRIYFAFKPLWWMLHYWDEILADKFIPALSFGFNTLEDNITNTVNPDKSPGTTTCDGGAFTFTNSDGSDWGDIRGDTHQYVDLYSFTGVGPVYEPYDYNWYCYIKSEIDGGYDSMQRTMFLFDTSSLGSGSTVSAAIASWAGAIVDDISQAHPAINVFSSDPASNTSIAATYNDFNSLGSTPFCDTQKTPTTWNINLSSPAYNDFSFNASGLAAISKTGITKLGLRDSAWDVPNINPGLEGNGNDIGLGGYFANHTGTSFSPKLVVTYTTGGTAFVPIVMVY